MAEAAGAVMKKLSFREMAVRQLREHRYCGDCYPENGWPGVNAALAQYALEKRKPKKRFKPKPPRYDDVFFEGVETLDKL